MICSIIAFLALIVCACYLKCNYRGKQFPPGPLTHPILGNFNLRKPHHVSFLDLGKKYGDVFSIRFGCTWAIVLNNFQDIKECFLQKCCSGRGNFALERSGGIPRGIIFNSGSSWKRERDFAVASFRGIQGDNLEEAISDLIVYLQNKVGSVIDIRHIFNVFVLNSLWKAIAGTTFENNDPVIKSLVKELTNKRIQSRIASVAAFVPPVGFVLKLFSRFKTTASSTEKTMELIRNTIGEVFQNYKPDCEPRNFIEQYIQETNATKDGQNSFRGSEEEKNLEITLLDLFIGGLESTAAALQWIFLYLAKYPSVQERVFQEIDSQVGQDRNATLADRPSLPLTTGVIMEVLRCTSLVPLALPHFTEEEATIRGYKIPAGTMIIPNLFAVMHNPAVWETPDEFKPDRFLNNPTPTYIPFSIGRRICFGKSIAEQNMFLFTASVLQRFKVTLGHPDQTLESVGGKLLLPKHTSLCFTFRT